jgi:hypothetical protein
VPVSFSWRFPPLKYLRKLLRPVLRRWLNGVSTSLGSGKTERLTGLLIDCYITIVEEEGKWK